MGAGTNHNTIRMFSTIQPFSCIVMIPSAFFTTPRSGGWYKLKKIESFLSRSVDIPAENKFKQRCKVQPQMTNTMRLHKSIHLEGALRRPKRVSMRRACVPAMKMIIVVVVLLCVPVRGDHGHPRDSDWLTWLRRAMAPSATHARHARHALTSSHGRTTISRVERSTEMELKGPESQFLSSSNGRIKSQVPISVEEPASTEQEARGNSDDTRRSSSKPVYALVAMRGGGEHVFGFDTTGEDQSNKQQLQGCHPHDSCPVTDLTR